MSKASANHEGLLAQERVQFLDRTRLILFYLAAPLVISFTLVDWFFAPDHWITFGIARLIVIPVSGVCIFLNRTGIVRSKYFTLPIQFLCLYLAIYNAFMIAETGFEKSPYYAGLNLVAFGSLFFLPWPPKQVIVNTLTIYTPYLITIFFLNPSSPDASYWVPSLAFCSSTILIGVITGVFMRDLRQKELLAEAKLKEEIENKALIIKQKTDEGVLLQTLNVHFAPAVTKRIAAKEVSLETLHNREISSIFVDVAKSTKRSLRIHPIDYNNVIADFYSAVEDILYKHELTIGTYMGDGVFAFANAPINQPDHQKRVFAASLEILQLVEAKSKNYKEIWRNTFTIRIGLGTGYAKVGFFPKQDKGVYTASGQDVNLTKRLCDAAEDNSILVTKSFLRAITDKLTNSIIVKGPVAFEADQLKGYEGEEISAYNISLQTYANMPEINKCPLCASELVSSGNDSSDLIFLKCSKVGCNFQDFVDKKAS